jgi:hypothetical protein
MHTRRPGRLSGAATRRLLDGDGAPPLAQILAAATAPATAAELRGESAARAAFHSAPHSAPVPEDVPRRPPVRAASTFMIAKAVAAIALAASTAGGIALATTSTPADPHTVTTTEAAASGGATPSAVVNATPEPALAPSDDAADPLAAAAAGRSASTGAAARTTPAAAAAHPTGLCRASANVATGDHAGKAAGSPALTDVECADADAGTAIRSVPPSGRPSTATDDPGHRTGKPDTTDRAKDDIGDKAEKAGKRAEGQGQGDAARAGNAGHGGSADNRRNG